MPSRNFKCSDVCYFFTYYIELIRILMKQNVSYDVCKDSPANSWMHVMIYLEQVNILYWIVFPWTEFDFYHFTSVLVIFKSNCKVGGLRFTLCWSLNHVIISCEREPTGHSRKACSIESRDLQQMHASFPKFWIFATLQFSY